jgi:hypothetical protein
VWLYLAADVAQLAAAGVSTRHGAAEDSPDWLTVAEARDRFGFTKHVLLHWRTGGCLYLDGRRLAARRMKSLVNGQVRVAWRYSLRDLEAIAERQARCSDRIFPDAAGWFTAGEIKRDHGIRESILAYWRNAGRVRARKIPTPPDKASAHKMLWVYHMADVLSARAAPDGRSKEARRLRAEKARPAEANGHDTTGVAAATEGERPRLNDTEQGIVKWLGERGPALGKEIARGLEARFNSHFRVILRGLVRKGVIRKDPDGYAV